MADPAVSFSDPIVRAFERMSTILFRPFSLEKWIVIGFAAWLAGLASGGPGSVSWAINGAPSRSAAAPVEAGGRPVLAAAAGAAAAAGSDALSLGRFDYPGWEGGWGWFVAGCVALAVLFALAVLVVLVWLSSRATFVFLDDVVRDTAQIVRPWREYARLGDSLFLWRLAFGLVVLVLMGLGLAGSVGAAAVTGSPVFLAPWIVVIAVFVPAVIYVDVFLRHFVVPVMYLHGMTATAAWGRFLGLFRSQPLPFLVYGLLLLALWMGVGSAILAVGLFTCCLGLVFVALPYVGTVLLLPVHVFFRQLSLEFLAQFGPGFEVPARAPAAERPAGS